MMEHNEGAALHVGASSKMVEDQTWYEPQGKLSIPSDQNVLLTGLTISSEVDRLLDEETLAQRVYPAPDSMIAFARSDADIQREREAPIMPVSYLYTSEIPQSPAEPPVDTASTSETKAMELGPKLDTDHEVKMAISQAHRPPTLASGSQLSSLLAQITGGAPSPVAYPGQPTSSALSSLLASVSTTGLLSGWNNNNGMPLPPPAPPVRNNLYGFHSMR